MNLLHLLAALLLITTLALTPRAHAALSSKPIIDGLTGGTYKPLSTPALTGNNFVATGRVLVNGKWINIPGYVPPASTAAQAARTSLWLNPWLIGASLLAWSGDAGLGSDQVAWTITLPSSLDHDPNKEYTVSAYPPIGYFPSAQEACDVYFALADKSCDPAMTVVASDMKCYLNYSNPIACGVSPSQNPFAWLFLSWRQVAVCPSGSIGTPPNCVSEPQTRPATEDDFDALPDPPAQALAELAPQVGVPVDDPVYQPIDVDIGAPYTKPDGSTAQQRAKISPAGNGDVWIDTYEQPVTDSQGNPVQNPEPVDLPEPQLTQCDKYPDTVGCARLGSIPDETLPTENRSIALIQPVDIGNAGQCPAPMTATVAGMTIEWSFDPLCQYANALRPLVLALAWLSAGLIFIGGVRNG